MITARQKNEPEHGLSTQTPHFSVVFFITDPWRKEGRDPQASLQRKVFKKIKKLSHGKK